MINSLIFIETNDQVDEYIRIIHPSHSKSQSIVALSPVVEFRLEKADINFVVPEDFTSNNEIDAIGDKSFKIVEDICLYADKKIGEIFPKIDLLTHGPTYYEFRYIKTLYDQFAMKIHLVSVVVNELNPEKIIYFQTERDKSLGKKEKRRLYFGTESIYSLVITLVCEKNGIESIVQSIEAKVTIKPRNSDKLNLRFLIRKIDKGILTKVYMILISYKYLPSRLKSLLTREDKRAIWFFSASHDLRELLREIAKGNLFRILIWNGTGIRKVIHLFYPILKRMSNPLNEAESHQESKEVWVILKEDREFKDFFSYDGLNFFESVSEKLHWFYTKGIAEFCLMFDNAKELIRQRNPAALIFSIFGESAQGALFAAAKASGLPVITYQHGGVLGYAELPIMNYSDVGLSDYLFSYGVGVTEHIGKEFQNKPVRIANTGSADLERIGRKLLSSNSRQHSNLRKETNLNVLFISTSMQGQTLYLSHNSYSDHDLWMVQRTVVDIFSEFPQHNYVIKLHPGDQELNPISKYVSSSGIPRCDIKKNVDTISLIKDADLLLIDHPSTVLLQCMMTDKPILLYNRSTKIYGDALKLLIKRVSYTEDMEELKSILRVFLAKPEKAVANHNKEFIKRFGTHLDDGRSAERALEELKKIVSLHSPDTKNLMRV